MMSAIQTAIKDKIKHAALLRIDGVSQFIRERPYQLWRYGAKDTSFASHLTHLQRVLGMAR